MSKQLGMSTETPRRIGCPVMEQGIWFIPLEYQVALVDILKNRISLSGLLNRGVILWTTLSVVALTFNYIAFLSVAKFF